MPVCLLISSFFLLIYILPLHNSPARTHAVLLLSGLGLRRITYPVSMLFPIDFVPQDLHPHPSASHAFTFTSLQRLII